jgi:serine O-acetyltransferase
MSNNNPLTTSWQLLRQDAARWVRPEQFSDPQLVTPMVVARLLLRHPSFRATTWMRIGTAASEWGIRGFPSWVQRRLLRLYGIELKVGAVVGGGLYVAHPVGCVLAAESIGNDVTVISQVTFGTRDDGSWPRIGDRTFFGAGCRVLGGVAVGTGARIGANAVVLTDVAPGETAVGVPARARHESVTTDDHS